MNFLKIFNLEKLSYGERLRPTRDWLFIISIVGILFVASAGYNYWLFSETKTTENSSSKVTVVSSTTSSTSSVADIFSARAREQENYMKVYRFVDPSR